MKEKKEQEQKKRAWRKFKLEQKRYSNCIFELDTEYIWKNVQNNICD